MYRCCQSDIHSFIGKSANNCLETIWWHLIEKRFCYDESIALYEVPEKQEKNNNMFENMAFYDSVSVIAGRAVVTIEPLPEKKQTPIVQQPKVTITPVEEIRDRNRASLARSLSVSAPNIGDFLKDKKDEQDVEPKDMDNIIVVPDASADKHLKTDDTNIRKNSFEITKSAETLTEKANGNTLIDQIVELRKKSLMERRVSRSLFLKIECVDGKCREVPIIRQNSMPKFYLGTPEDHQIETAIFRTPSIALTSPVPAFNRDGFAYDLSSVVQIEKEKAFNTPQVQEQGKKQFRDKIVKLRRIKSTMSAFQIHHI